MKRLRRVGQNTRGLNIMKRNSLIIISMIFGICLCDMVFEGEDIYLSKIYLPLCILMLIISIVILMIVKKYKNNNRGILIALASSVLCLILATTFAVLTNYFGGRYILAISLLYLLVVLLAILIYCYGVFFNNIYCDIT